MVAVATVAFPTSALAVSSVTVVPPAGPAGTVITVGGLCDTPALPAAQVTLSTPTPQSAIDSTLVAGAFSVNLTVPLGSPAATYSIAIQCGVVAGFFIPLENGSASFTVPPLPAPAAAAAPTPITGLDLTGFENFSAAVPVTSVPRFTG